MKALARVALCALAILLGPAAARAGQILPAAAKVRAASMAEQRSRCAGKDGWSDPAPPVRIFGDVYDVGTCGIVVVLVAGPDGAIMIDGATAAAVPSIEAEMPALPEVGGEHRELGLEARTTRLHALRGQCGSAFTRRSAQAGRWVDTRQHRPILTT
jgi:hypothetical protein